MTWVYPLDNAHDLPPDELVRLVGGKAANLGVMARDLGLPVPPGFVITTAACSAALGSGWPDDLDEEIRAAMSTVEARLGRRFGDPDAPLLVSVRSGAPVSMPGMMDTILNVGLTPATEAGLAGFAGEAFARDCRERLLAMFRDTAGVQAPDDPWQQLQVAAEAVFRSWNSDRAGAYRAREGIADDLGTAVTVQAMVFGNRDDRSATGVAFTRNPATGADELYGDILFRAQGEDVVAGTQRTEPLARLAERLPEAAADLRAHAGTLERHFADMCDIEFTIESGRLWMLQVRPGKRSPEAALQLAVDLAEAPEIPLTREAAVRRVADLLGDPPQTTTVRSGHGAPMAHGLPASPGIATGVVATTSESAEAVAARGTAVILVRDETSPADVRGMSVAAGILTARGGLTSHAAVVARGWGIPAVVGAEGLRVRPQGIELGGKAIAAGELLSIDGGAGNVHAGSVEVERHVSQAAATLLGWARELGIAIEPRRAEKDGTADTVRRAVDLQRPIETLATADAEACLRAIGIKGFATAEAVATAVGASPEQTETLTRDLVERGLATPAAGAYRLTEAGDVELRRLVDAERERLGSAATVAMLDEFLDLDRRVKQVVTSWQLRLDRSPDAPPPNDHTDAAYDAGVLDALGRLDAEAQTWLADAAGSSARFSTYGARLKAAAEAAIAGDGRFVASPRVDSFHGVWFELHEDLILLAGRTREDETAAGRA